LKTAPLNAYVFGPDLLGGGLVDPRARAVLERWRDGKFKVVINDELLLIQLRTLRELGLSAGLIKRWSYWLTDERTSVHVEATGANPMIMLCEKLAKMSQAEGILCWRKPEGASPHWIAAAELIGPE
jgi:hypothetical protein